MDLERENKNLKEAFGELAMLSFDLQKQIQQLENKNRVLSKEKAFKVITLCGSTKFKKQFEEVNEKLTLEGNMVISVGIFVHDEGLEISEEQKHQLDQIHFQKIDFSDEIFVINVDGYVGSSTKKEIEYAKLQGIPVKYLYNCD